MGRAKSAKWGYCSKAVKLFFTRRTRTLVMMNLCQCIRSHSTGGSSSFRRFCVGKTCKCLSCAADLLRCDELWQLGFEEYLMLGLRSTSLPGSMRTSHSLLHLDPRRWLPFLQMSMSHLVVWLAPTMAHVPSASFPRAGPMRIAQARARASNLAEKRNKGSPWQGRECCQLPSSI